MDFCEENFNPGLLHVPGIRDTHPLFSEMKDKAYLILKDDMNFFMNLDAGRQSRRGWSRDDGLIHITSGPGIRGAIDKFKRGGIEIAGIAVKDENETFGFKLIKLKDVDSIC